MRYIVFKNKVPEWAISWLKFVLGELGFRKARIKQISKQILRCSNSSVWHVRGALALKGQLEILGISGTIKKARELIKASGQA